MSFTVANAKENTLSKAVKSNKYCIDDYEIDLKNQNDSHAILANHAIKTKAKQILDVGCGVGYIGRTIKKHQPCTVDGIDIDKTALKIANKYYDNTFLLQLGDKTDKAYLSFLKDPKVYDCIICGDIIEHLSDPGYIISILAKKLAPNGKILISIPNIAHIDVIANLLDGRFNYGETGILDNTHLRFWTESSFYDFIKNINEHYKTTLSPKLIGQTIISQNSFDTQDFYEICGEEIFIFQNLFELTNQKNPTIPHPRKKSNFVNLSTAIAARKKIATLEAELAEKDKIIHDMEASLSWKITEPLRKSNAFFHSHKK